MSGPWYRVLAVPGGLPGGSAERDYAAVLPAALDASRRRRRLATGWLCRGSGAPLELITNAGPLGSRDGPAAGPAELVFPWGRRGVPAPGSSLAFLAGLVWAPC